MISEGRGSESGDGGQYLICGFGPVEGFRLLVVDGDELTDGSLQFLNTAMGTALDLSLGKQCEPAFDLIEPGGMRRREVQMIPWPLL